MKTFKRQWVLASIISAVLAVGIVSAYWHIVEKQGAAHQTVISTQLLDHLSKLDERLRLVEATIKHGPMTGLEPTDSAELSVQLSRIAEPLDTISQRLAELERRMANDSRKTNAGSAYQFKELPAQAEESERKYERLVSGLEYKLASQEVDPDLGANVAALAGNLLTRKSDWLMHGRVSTDCGSTICRIEVEFAPDMTPIDRFEFENALIQELASELPEGAALRYHTDQDGSQRLVGYFGRSSDELVLP